MVAVRLLSSMEALYYKLKNKVCSGTDVGMFEGEKTLLEKLTSSSGSAEMAKELTTLLEKNTEVLRYSDGDKVEIATAEVIGAESGEGEELPSLTEALETVCGFYSRNKNLIDTLVEENKSPQKS